MITSGKIRNEKLKLISDKTKDAEITRGALAGKNNHFYLSPYGNYIDISIDGAIITLTKHSGRIFTYEEVKNLIKKMQSFERIRKKEADEILGSARDLLDAKLTSFFPAIKKPIVEISFSYNWVSIEFQCKDFDKIYSKIQNSIADYLDKNIKICSNNYDIVTLHNYSMAGISISRKALEALADIFIEENIVAEAGKTAFVARNAAFGAKSVSYMEARNLCKNADESFSINNEQNYNSDIGNREYIALIFDIFDKLSLKGDFLKLDNNQMQLLKELLVKPENIEQHKVLESIKNHFINFAEEFHEEITLRPIIC